MLEDPAIRWGDIEKPEAAVKRPVTSDQAVKEIYSLPAEWESVRWQRKGHEPNDFVEVEGGVFREKIQRGARKGKTDYKKPEPGTSATLSLSRKAWDAWKQAWEQATGLCSRCSGSGWAVTGWHHQKGTASRKCTACDGNGNALNREKAEAL